MAGSIGELFVAIKGDTSGINKSVDATKKSLDGVTTQTAKTKNGFLAMIPGPVKAATAIGALVVIAKKLIGVYEVQEQAETALNAALKITGDYTPTVSRELQAYATELQGVTKYGDEATLAAMGMLQQFADLGEDGLKKLTPLVQDFASSLGLDLKTAASLVGKTLGSSTNALTRYGVEIDMTGTKEEKLAELTAAMTAKFGGMAQELASTGTGALKQYQNVVGDVKEGLGALVVEGITPFVKIMTNYATRVATALNETRQFKETLGRLQNGTADTQDKIVGLTSKLDSLNNLQAMYNGTLSDNVINLEEKKTANLEAIAALEAELEAVNQLRIAEERSVGQQLRGAEIQTKIAADRAASDAAFIELANIIEERRQSALTDDEKAIEALQIEIDENAKLKTALQETGKVYEGVQLLINDLVEQRDTVISKIEEETDAAEINAKTTIDLWQAVSDKRKTLHDLILEMNAKEIESNKILVKKTSSNWVETIGVIESGMSNLTDAVSGDMEDMYDVVWETASDIAALFGTTGKIASAVMDTLVLVKTATESLNDTVFGVFDDYAEGYKDVQLQILEYSMDTNDQIYANTKTRLDKELAAETLTQEEYQDLLENAKTTQTAANAQYKIDTAILEREITLAEIEISRASAIADLGWFNKDKKTEVNALFDELVTAVNAVPLPAPAATGGLFDEPFIMAEAGVSEYAIPNTPAYIGSLATAIVDQMKSLPDNSATESKMIHLTFQMGSKVLYDDITEATKDKKILISAGAVV